jgi:hypothetical protein
MADETENKKGDSSAEKDAGSGVETQVRDRLIDEARDLRRDDEREKPEKKEEPSSVDTSDTSGADGKTQAQVAADNLKQLLRKNDPSAKLDSVPVGDISNLTKDDGSLATLLGLPKTAGKNKGADKPSEKQETDKSTEAGENQSSPDDPSKKKTLADATNNQPNDVANPAVQNGTLDASTNQNNDSINAVQRGTQDATNNQANDQTNPAIQNRSLDAANPAGDLSNVAVQRGALDAANNQANDLTNPAVQNRSLDATNKQPGDLTNGAVQRGTLDGANTQPGDLANAAMQRGTLDAANVESSESSNSMAQKGTLDAAKKQASDAAVQTGTLDAANGQTNDQIANPAVQKGSLDANDVASPAVQRVTPDATNLQPNDQRNPAVQNRSVDATNNNPTGDLANNAVQRGTLDAAGNQTNDLANAAVQRATLDASNAQANDLANAAVQRVNPEASTAKPNDLANQAVQRGSLDASSINPHDQANPEVQRNALDVSSSNPRDVATPAVQNESLDGIADGGATSNLNASPSDAFQNSSKLNLDFAPPPLTGGAMDPVSGQILPKAAADNAAKQQEEQSELERQELNRAAASSTLLEGAQTTDTAQNIQARDAALDRTPAVNTLQARDGALDVTPAVNVENLDRTNLNLDAAVVTNNLAADTGNVLDQVPVSDRPVVLTRSLNAVSDAAVEPGPVVAAESTENRGDVVTEVPSAVVTPPATPARAGMSDDALAAAAQTVKDSLRNRATLDAVLRSIPPESKEAFEQIYKQNTGNDLRRDLTRNGHESSIALLNPREEARNAQWLGDRLRDLSRLPAGATQQRELLEHGLRSSLRTMTPEQRTSLSNELEAKHGKNLQQMIDLSKMSQASKDIAGIIINNTEPQLSAAALNRIADIGLKTGGSQGLTILKEAFGGNTQEAIDARRQFNAENGQQRLHNTFAGMLGGDTAELRQARDYANQGKLDTATFIEMQRSNWANSDAGVELVARMMSQDERQRLSVGERLAKENSQGNTPEEREARQYYDRVHAAFQNAASSIGMISRWSTSNQNKAVTAWEDIAKHGELTLIGRMARAGNDFFADSSGTILGAMRDNLTNKDFNLMQDPKYRDAVYNMLGGRDGTGRSDFSPEASAAARQEIEKLFNKSNVNEAREANHATLREAASDRIQMTKVTEQYGRSSHSVTFDALRNAKASDYAQLSPQERRQLEQRVDNIPLNMRTEARAMLNELKGNKDVTPSLARDLLNDALKNVPQNKIIERLIANQGNLPQTPQEMQALTKATRDALTVVAGNRAEQVFDRFAKPLLEGKGLSADALREANMSSRVFGADRLNHENYYNQLKHLPKEERERLTGAADRASTDPEARRTLDEAFKGMSQAERDIALSVLRNPNQEYSLSDRIRTLGIGGDVNQQALVSEFQALNRDAKMNLINEHAAKYQSFLPNDLGKDAGESVKREIEMSLPMPTADLQRAMQDRIRETGTGLYGNTALTEISIAQTQEQMKSQLLDHLPPAERERAQREIDEKFQALVSAIRRNDDAKDQYAKDLADKIVTVATTVVGGPLMSGGLKAANLARLAVTAAGAVAARVGIEESVKGEGTLSANDYMAAGIFGAVDGVTMGRFSAAKNAFAPAVEKALASRLASHGARDEVRDGIVSQWDRFMAKDGEEKLAAHLREKGITDPEVAAREIRRDVTAAMNKVDDVAENTTRQTTPEEMFRQQIGRATDALSKEVGDAGMARIADIQKQMQPIKDLLRSGTQADLEQATKLATEYLQSVGRNAPFNKMPNSDIVRSNLERLVARVDNVDALLNGGRMGPDGMRVPLSKDEMAKIVNDDLGHFVADPSKARFADQFDISRQTVADLKTLIKADAREPVFSAIVANAVTDSSRTLEQRAQQIIDKITDRANDPQVFERNLPLFEKELIAKGMDPADARRILDLTKNRLDLLKQSRGAINEASGMAVRHTFDAAPTRESIEQAGRNLGLTGKEHDNFVASAREFFKKENINGQSNFQVVQGPDGKLMLSRMEPGRDEGGMKVILQPLKSDGTVQALQASDLGLNRLQSSDNALHLTYRNVAQPDGTQRLTIVEVKQGSTTASGFNRATDQNAVIYQHTQMREPHVNSKALEAYLRQNNQTQQEMVDFFQNLVRRNEVAK